MHIRIRGGGGEWPEKARQIDPLVMAQSVVASSTAPTAKATATRARQSKNQSTVSIVTCG